MKTVFQTLYIEFLGETAAQRKTGTTPVYRVGPQNCDFCGKAA